MDRALPTGHRRGKLIKQTTVALGALTGVVALVALATAWLRPSVSRNRIRTARVELGRGGSDHQRLRDRAARGRAGGRQPGGRARAEDPQAPRRPSCTRASRCWSWTSPPRALALQRLDQDLALKENMQAKTRLDLEAPAGRAGRAAGAEAPAARPPPAPSWPATASCTPRGFLSQDELTQLGAGRGAGRGRAAQARGRDRATPRRPTRTQIDGLRPGDGHPARRAGRGPPHRWTLATTRADRRGVLTFTVSEEGAAVKKGDLLARIADLGSFRVEATVSDVHAQRLAAGLPVAGQGRARASPGRARSATFTRPSSRGVITFSVALDREVQPPAPLEPARGRAGGDRPQGRGRCAWRAAPSPTGEGTREVFVVRGDRAVRTRARFGLPAPTTSRCCPGCRAGDEVIISDMTDLPAPARARPPLRQERPTDDTPDRTSRSCTAPTASRRWPSPTST